MYIASYFGMLSINVQSQQRIFYYRDKINASTILYFFSYYAVVKTASSSDKANSIKEY